MSRYFSSLPGELQSVLRPLLASDVMTSIQAAGVRTLTSLHVRFGMNQEKLLLFQGPRGTNEFTVLPMCWASSFSPHSSLPASTFKKET